jgi:hypothetical protein
LNTVKGGDMAEFGKLDAALLGSIMVTWYICEETGSRRMSSGSFTYRVVKAEIIHLQGGEGGDRH